MASNLIEYATSLEFISSARSMRRLVDKPKVYLYVEDDLDKAFWRKIIDPYSDVYEFEISVIENLSGELIPGKDYMLKCVKEKSLQLNSYVMCCVDADYDLIINDSEKYSDLIRKNAYVIHTHWYSMENLKCYPLNQYNDIAYRVSLPKTSICNDFSCCLAEISKLLSRLILFTILDKKIGLGEFTVKDLKSFVSNVSIFNSDLTIRDEFQSKIREKEEILQQRIDSNMNEFIEIQSKLNGMGYTPDNYYCIMQGHTLLENIAAEIIKAVSEPIRDAWFRNLSGTKEQKKLASEHYAHNTGVNDNNQESLKVRIESMFRDNYDVENTEAYTIIQKQINKALASRQIFNILNSLVKKNKMQPYK